MGLLDHCITPNWPAPANVKALQTTRLGGVSATPYDTLNLGLHVGDDSVRVNRNRQSLAPFMPSEPVWLEQVHGTVVANADAAACRVQADACIARQRGSVCVVMTADCLPVLMCDEAGTVVGAVHAGWKGLAAGVIEATVRAMEVAPQKLLAWFGPAIGQEAFEVGAEVRAAFVGHQAQAAEAFIAHGNDGKYHADIYLLARQRLHMLGIERIHGGNYCTFHQRDKFFSYRRDGVTGRMGTFIWLA
ncbi:polyphenol oxidase [Sideroxyarcus emersonii]|uniref:Purine nucleoside phosphorylase n=1 Tax=Sideroxyarcus emersonii TaxID=2764705 RepID=A0AAN1X9Y0_9PROT|nr:peptidoglycan editing factor PgeF [Sideroxyarcus emersonii]BCK87272.1 polyphenol oxidase [Sideroxyarcus emersonii]